MPVTRRGRLSDRSDFRHRIRREQRASNGRVLGAGPLGGGAGSTTISAARGSSGGNGSVAPLPAGASGARATVADDGSNLNAICGYEARFERVLDKKYVCPVCLAALRDPVQTKCGHRFCKFCLSRASGSGNTAKCPLDKLWFDVRSEVFEDVAMKREVLSLGCMCSNVDNGCEWKGELRELEEHGHTCPHAMIQCPNGCQAHHKRKDAEDHLKECPLRQVECSYCQQQIMFKYLSQHQLHLCPRYAIDCPLCGKGGILRENMPSHTDHKDGDCPKAIVPCSFAEIGCQSKVGRCDIQLHHKESTGQHLQLLLSHYTAQMETVQEQGVAVLELRETCTRLACQNTEKDRKLLELKQEVDTLREELTQSRTTSYNGQLLWKVQVSSREFTVPLLSPPFFTSQSGYKLRLCLELRGHVTRSDSYASLFVMLCRGEHDDRLYFPFSATCALMLFDQGDGQNHLTTNITCQKMPRPYEDQMQRRGRLKFMKTDTLINGRFCNAGAIYIQARVTTMPISTSNLNH